MTSRTMSVFVLATIVAIALATPHHRFRTGKEDKENPPLPAGMDEETARPCLGLYKKKIDGKMVITLTRTVQLTKKFTRACAKL